MDQTVNIVVALLSILVLSDWNDFVSLLSIFELDDNILFIFHTVRGLLYQSKSTVWIDWGIGLISMVSLQTYLGLFRALHSKLVTSFSSRERPFFVISNLEFNSSYLIKLSNRLYRPLSLSKRSGNFKNFSISSSFDRLSAWGLVRTIVNFQNKI